MNTEFPCECGHSKEDHIPLMNGKEGYCNVLKEGRRLRASMEDYEDTCFIYKPDNLRYLERLSD